MAGTLTAAAVRAARHPGGKVRPVRFGDGGGLYLQVASGNTKSWLFRYTLAGKAREMGLGPVGEPPAGVPLAKARLSAAEARGVLRAGRETRSRSGGRRTRRAGARRPTRRRAPSGPRRLRWPRASGRAGAAPGTPRSGWRRSRRTPSR
jgi:hypothetical protein